MTGSLQKKNGRFYMVINHIDSQGKRKNKWISTKLEVKGNKKKAEDMLAQWLHEHKECNLDKANLLVADYMEEWMSVAQLRLKPTTIRGYNGCLKNHILPYFRDQQTKLLNLDVCDLESFYAFLASSKKLSAESIRRCHGILSKALNDAFRRKQIPYNPAAIADAPKHTKYVGAFLDYENLKLLVAQFQGTLLYEVVALIATYGLRRGEALGLRWEKVDFPNNRFTISHTLVDSEEGVTLQPIPKNTPSYRSFPLTAEMRKMLLALKAVQQENQKLFQDQYENEHGLVFTWADGKWITPNYLSSNFHDIVKASPIQTVRLHDLRHSVASNLLALGCSVSEVLAWLGHSQASTTLNIYGHVMTSFKEDMCEKWSKKISFQDPAADTG